MTTGADDEESSARPLWRTDRPADRPAGPGGRPDPQDGPGPQARLTVASVARRLGVAPSTLRTWARRYGLGPSEHAAGAHRRYTPADLARLETMRRLTLEGVAPAEAASVALAWSADHPPVPAAGVRRGRGGPGGKVLALPGAAGVVRGLGRAAMALDSTTVTDIVRGELDERGVLHTWEHVLLPVLVAVGARWAATGEGVEVEHLLSDCVATALRQHAHGAAEPASGRPVLLACAPGDQHVLPLNALAAGLAERGTAARVLGAALPTEALQAAVRRTGPAVLFLWSQLAETADPAVLDAMPVTRPATVVLVGGPGWDRDQLPPRVSAVTDLSHAVNLVGQALGA